MSVEANIAFPLQVRKKPGCRDQAPRRRDDRARRPEGAREEAARRKLSGGQQQRVALARALVFEPGVLLARRAVLGARQEPARPDAGRDEAPAPGNRHDLRLRHPRPERGAGAVVAHRHLQPRRAAAGRRAAGGLRAAGQPLRRRVPGRDQHAAAEGRPAGRRRRDRPLRGPHRSRCATRKGVGGDAFLAIRPEHMAIASEAAVRREWDRRDRRPPRPISARRPSSTSPDDAGGTKLTVSVRRRHRRESRLARRQFGLARHGRRNRASCLRGSDAQTINTNAKKGN